MSLSTEKKLIDIALQIGNIADSNNHYTAALAARINATGKTVEQLSIAELKSLIEQCNQAFNEGVEPELLKGNLENDEVVQCMKHSPEYQTPGQIRALAPELSEADDEALEDLISAQYALKMAEDELVDISRIDGLPAVRGVDALINESNLAMIHLHNARRLANQLTNGLLGATS